MSASELIYCRFCAENVSALEYIDISSDSLTRSDIIEKLASLNINFIDLNNSILPETVCVDCYNIFKHSYEFFAKIKLSQAILENVSKINSFTHEVSRTCMKEENDIQEDIKSRHKYTSYDMKTDGNSNCTNDFDYDTETPKCDVSWINYECYCKFCGLNCSDMVALREHCKEVHNSCCGFRCSDCQIEIEEFDMFVEHAREHVSELSLYCQYCNIKFDNVDHVTTHKLQPNCQYCGEIFRNDILLNNHLNLYQDLSKKLNQHKITELKELLSYGVEIYDLDRLKIEFWKQYPWICQFCCMKFPSQNVLRSHVKEVHRKCFGMKCCDCHEVYKTFGLFIEHVRIHRPVLRLCCQYCDAKFDSQNLTTIHTNTHLQCPQCEACGETFTNKTDLQQHITAYSKRPKRTPFKKRDKPITVDDLTCNICQKVTKSLSNLRAHKILHTDRNRDYTCDRCGKAFFTKGALYTHSFIHKTSEPQVCKICKKSFLTLTRLKKHVKTHYGEKPFECNVCLRRFRLKDHLKGHMITHTDVLPYSCQYCNKGFRHKNVLKTHENLHTGAKPFSCTICGMDFANWSNCNKHMKRKHGATLAKNVLTPHGKVPINPKTGKPKKMKDLESVKEWTDQIMVPCKRGRKTGNEGVLA